MAKKQIKTNQADQMIQAVEEYIRKTYGTIQPEWQMTITILGDVLKRYFQVRDEINNQGITNDKGFKSQLLSTEKDCIATILKLSQKLGVSPWDSSKIKLTEEENAEDYIDQLIS